MDGGFRAAELLNRFISGDLSAEGMKITYGVRKIEERASTADVRGMARSVALACEFIRKNAESHIGIDDVVAACGTSKRLLEKNFRAVLNTTAVHELQRSVR